VISKALSETYKA
jgi:hypothetical protein